MTDAHTDDDIADTMIDDDDDGLLVLAGVAGACLPVPATPGKELAIIPGDADHEDFDEDLTLLKISYNRIFRRAIQRGMHDGEPYKLAGIPDLEAAAIDAANADREPRELLDDALYELSVAKAGETELDETLAAWLDELDEGRAAWTQWLRIPA